MKAAQLREMTDKELDQKLTDARKELFNLRFQMAAGQLEHTHRLKVLRKDIARILTIKHVNELSPEDQQLIAGNKEKKEKVKADVGRVPRTRQKEEKKTAEKSADKAKKTTAKEAKDSKQSEVK